jgi:hypothetical protein
VVVRRLHIADERDCSAVTLDEFVEDAQHGVLIRHPVERP